MTIFSVLVMSSSCVRTNEEAVRVVCIFRCIFNREGFPQNRKLPISPRFFRTLRRKQKFCSFLLDEGHGLDLFIGVDLQLRASPVLTTVVLSHAQDSITHVSGGRHLQSIYAEHCSSAFASVCALGLFTYREPSCCCREQNAYVRGLGRFENMMV